MKNPLNKWILIPVMMLGVASIVCEKTTATETAGSSSVLHPIPWSSHADKKTQPPVETESTAPMAEKQGTVAVQEQISEEDPKTGNQRLEDVNSSYEAKSKLNPFMPLIQQKPATPAEVRKPDKPRRILTPLEKMSLSQIKLVAVVMGENFTTSMVEDSTGKGYEVRIGTYIGKNGGQVVDIQSDRIIVREMETDFKGVATERFQELRLHKPDNGE